jgi:hypothetical protein
MTNILPQAGDIHFGWRGDGKPAPEADQCHKLGVGFAAGIAREQSWH